MYVSPTSVSMRAGVKRTRRLDQASGLRAAMIPTPSKRRQVQVIAVSSGKGGVGNENDLTL